MVELPNGDQIVPPEGFRGGRFAPFPFNPQDFALLYRDHRATLGGHPRFHSAIAVGLRDVAGPPAILLRAGAEAFRDPDWKGAVLERLDASGIDPAADGSVVLSIKVNRPGWFRARRVSATVLAGPAAGGRYSVAIYALGAHSEAQTLYEAVRMQLEHPIPCGP